jgi:hypothetical protein
MMHPDIAAALAAERRADMLAAASRHRARAEAARVRGPIRHDASRSARLVGRLIAWPPRPLWRAPAPPLPPCGCPTLPL